MDIDKTYKLFDDYLEGNLSNDAVKLFEKDLQNDKYLYHELEAYKLANSFIVNNELRQVKYTINEVHKKNIIKKKLMFLVAFLIVLGALIFLLLPNKVNDVKEVKCVTESIKKNNSIDSSFQESKNKLITNKLSVNKLVEPNPVSTNSPKDSLIEVNLTKATIDKLQNNSFLINNDSIPQKSTSITLPIIIDTVIIDSVKPPCDFHLNKKDVSIKETCENKRQGEIFFKLKTEAFKFSINGGKSFLSGNNFKYLSRGNYDLKIKNKRTKCESNSIDVEVKSIKCDYIINPNRFIYWEKELLNFNDDEYVLVNIFNAKTGGVVYSKEILISEGIRWDGKNNLNDILASGLYLYNIKGKEKTISGTVTIVN
jgi:hypothetical protein